MRPLYIFDLDGTLALIEHRLHFIQQKPKDWRGFFGAVRDDSPNMSVIQTLQAMRRADAEVWIWSGRSDECRAETVEWLQRNGCFGASDRFRMRKAGDYRDDVVVKSEWLAEVAPYDRQRLVAVFDDRDRVVAMWRAAGVPCFQVAAGGF